MTRRLTSSHNPHRSGPGSESGSAGVSQTSQPHFTVAFRLMLASLGVVLFACMTATRLIKPAPGSAAQPGVAPTPMASELPAFEQDYNKTLELIGSGQTQRLVELSAEGQQPPMYQAGTQTYTVSMAGSEIIDLGYDWCTKTDVILKDNMQHIAVSVTINGYEIPSKDFQAIDWASPAGSDPQFPQGLVCHSWVVLASKWAPGDYQVVETATFDSQINDGYDDYGAGAYTYQYQVHVTGSGPSARVGGGG